MEASGLPELLILVLGLGVLVVESAGVALLCQLLRHPSPRSPGQPHRYSGAVSGQPFVGPRKAGRRYLEDSTRGQKEISHLCGFSSAEVSGALSRHAPRHARHVSAALSINRGVGGREPGGTELPIDSYRYWVAIGVPTVTRRT